MSAKCFSLQSNPLQHRGWRWIGTLACVLVWALDCELALGQQIWEFSPYRVQVWISVDPSLEIDDDSRTRMVATIDDQLRATFRSAWALDSRLAPNHLRALFRRGLENLGLSELDSNELGLVVLKDSEQTNSVRSFEAAVERLSSIAVPEMELLKLNSARKEWQADARYLEPVDKLLAKCSAEKKSLAEIAKGIEDKSIEAALVPKSFIKQLDKFSRPIALPLPWQTDHFFRELDKAFFVVVDRTLEGVRVQARELDGPMRFLGPTVTRVTCSAEYAAQCASRCIIDAFAPVARAEEVELRTAKMRLRAGGLIMDRDNPAFLHPGDVLQPVIRRDDRNGVPALLEPLPWTYAVVTRTDGIKLDANVYSGIRGALQGQRNNRTQRILMRVRPTGRATEVQVVVKGASHLPQSGCEILIRDLSSEDLTPIGRTDWRGRLNITSEHASVRIVPDQFAQLQKKLELKPTTSNASATTSNTSSDTKTEPKNKQPSTPEPAANADQKTVPTTTKSAQEPDASEQDGKEVGVANHDSQPSANAQMEIPFAASVDLRQSLALLYVKSGNNVMARLPIVPGLAPMAIAELPSDVRRLEAEAFVKGFQAEVFDLIGMRNMLASRARKLISDNKNDEAQQIISQIRALRTYTEMADSLETLQRKVLDESNEAISLMAKNRIDRMFQTTRDSIQKYLQEDIVRKLEDQLRQAK